MSIQKQAAYERGLNAEALAESHLKAQGYAILAKRFKTKQGEIDILAAKDEFIVAVEVKARKTLEAALESVTPRSRKRIEQSLLVFIHDNPDYASAYLRFDIVAVIPPAKLHHEENAWQPGLA